MIRLNKQVPLEDILARQIHFWESTGKQRESIPGRLPCIAFSRQPGCSDMALANELSKRLNWKIFDKEIVEYIAGNNNIRKEMVEIFDEKTRTEMDNLFQALVNSHALNQQSYAKYLAKTIIGIGKHGAAIILGRGANFILPDKNALKIRIVEEFDDRVQNLVNLSIDRENAIRQLNEETANQKAFLNRLFGIKSLEATAFDIVINLSKMTVDCAADIIVCALTHKFKIHKDDLRVEL